MIFKHLHITFVALSILGFVLRGFWMLIASSNLQKKWVRILPHIIDTGLLLSAIAMLLTYPLAPWEHPWIMAKIVGLVLYIVLGYIALKKSNTVALCAALAVLAYIVAVAISKNPTLNLF